MSTTIPIRSRKDLEKFKDYYRKEKKNIRNYLLLVMGLNTALRISDLLRLNYDMVYDFKKQTWRSHIVLREQKTGKHSKIYINDEIKNTLNEYVKSHPPAHRRWLFYSQKSHTKPLSRYQAYRIVQKAAVYAGFESNISCHSLRKTFGYHAWKQGTPPVLLMNIYNHSSYQITKRYLGIDQDDKDSIYQKVLL